MVHVGFYTGGGIELASSLNDDIPNVGKGIQTQLLDRYPQTSISSLTDCRACMPGHRESLLASPPPNGLCTNPESISNSHNLLNLLRYLSPQTLLPKATHLHL